MPKFGGQISKKSRFAGMKGRAQPVRPGAKHPPGRSRRGPPHSLPPPPIHQRSTPTDMHFMSDSGLLPLIPPLENIVLPDHPSMLPYAHQDSSIRSLLDCLAQFSPPRSSPPRHSPPWHSPSRRSPPRYSPPLESSLRHSPPRHLSPRHSPPRGSPPRRPPLLRTPPRHSPARLATSNLPRHSSPFHAHLNSPTRVMFPDQSHSPHHGTLIDELKNLASELHKEEDKLLREEMLRKERMLRDEATRREEMSRKKDIQRREEMPSRGLNSETKDKRSGINSARKPEASGRMNKIRQRDSEIRGSRQSRSAKRSSSPNKLRRRSPVDRVSPRFRSRERLGEPSLRTECPNVTPNYERPLNRVAKNHDFFQKIKKIDFY